MSKEILHMPIDGELKESIKELARKQNRSMANFVETALKELVSTPKETEEAA